MHITYTHMRKKLTSRLCKRTWEQKWKQDPYAVTMLIHPAIHPWIHASVTEGDGEMEQKNWNDKRRDVSSRFDTDVDLTLTKKKTSSERPRRRCAFGSLPSWGSWRRLWRRRSSGRTRWLSLRQGICDDGSREWVVFFLKAVDKKIEIKNHNMTAIENHLPDKSNVADRKSVV